MRKKSKGVVFCMKNAHLLLYIESIAGAKLRKFFVLNKEVQVCLLILKN